MLDTIKRLFRRTPRSTSPTLTRPPDNGTTRTSLSIEQVVATEILERARRLDTNKLNRSFYAFAIELPKGESTSKVFPTEVVRKRAYSLRRRAKAEGVTLTVIHKRLDNRVSVLSATRTAPKPKWADVHQSVQGLREGETITIRIHGRDLNTMRAIAHGQAGKFGRKISTRTTTKWGAPALEITLKPN